MLYHLFPGDTNFAEKLYVDLQNNSVRCWFAPHHFQAGKKKYEQIDDAIAASDRLLLILSEESMASEWVKTEIALARRKEIEEGRLVLSPISIVLLSTIREWSCFDADTGNDSRARDSRIFFPDFNAWNDHDAYERALKGLVRDLKVD